MRIDAVDGVETRGGRARDEQIAYRTKSQVIGRDARFQGGEYKRLAIAIDLEDGSTAVAHVQVLLTVESNPGCDSHALGVGRHGAVRCDAINGAIMAGGNVHLAVAIEGDGGWVHQVAEKWLHGVVGIDLEERDRNLLSAAAREGDEDVAFGVDRGVGYRMQVVGDRDRDANLARVADRSV